MGMMGVRCHGKRCLQSWSGTSEGLRPRELDSDVWMYQNYYNSVHGLNGASSFEQSMVRQI